MSVVRTFVYSIFNPQTKQLERVCSEHVNTLKRKDAQLAYRTPLKMATLVVAFDSDVVRGRVLGKATVVKDKYGPVGRVLPVPDVTHMERVRDHQWRPEWERRSA